MLPSNLTHDRLVMPNCCVRCGLGTPDRGITVYGGQTYNKASGLVILAIVGFLVLAQILSFDRIITTIILGLGILSSALITKRGGLVYHRIRVPVCSSCWKHLQFMKRLAILSMLLGGLSVFVFVSYYQLPHLHGSKDEVMNITMGLFAGFFGALFFYILIDANLLKLNISKHLAYFDSKTRRFFFNNNLFQAAFTELNKEGYYQPDQKVSWHGEQDTSSK